MSLIRPCGVTGFLIFWNISEMMYKMNDSRVILDELSEFLKTYYNGSFLQMACDYIRSTGMTKEEVEELLEAMKHLGK